MILRLLSLLFIALSGVGVLLSLALGLLSLSRYIEGQAARSRRIGLYLVYVSVTVQLLIVTVDKVPFAPLLPNLLAHLLHYRALASPTWPYLVANGVWTALSFLLPLASHIWLARHHTINTKAWHLHRYDTLHRPKLPGGRLDWDVNPHTSRPQSIEMTHLQICAVLALCVWMVPVWRFLGRVAAAEWGSLGVETSSSPRHR